MKPVRPVRRMIKLQTRNGQGEDKQAEVYGPTGGELALFKVQHGWNITHVNTGMRVLEVFDKKQLAVKVLECLIDNASWAFGSFDENVEQRRLSLMDESICRAIKEAVKIRDLEA